MNEQAYALLVGVGDYRAFDPTGGADLKGAVNDVGVWWRAARALGVPPQNVRICVSPGLGGDALGPDGRHATVTGASHDELVEALKWLAERLDGEGGTKALLSWSGHGTRTADGEVLCPTDVYAEGETLHNALPVSAVAALLDTRAPATRITALVDTCHTDTGFEGGAVVVRGLPWKGAAPAALDAEASPHRAFGDLVVTSSAAGEPSYEMPTADGVLGAFTWAASSLLYRWGLVDAPGGSTARLSHGDLAERSAGLLRVMQVHQVPRYVGDARAARLRVFSAFGDGAIDSLDPQDLVPLEVWPDVPSNKPAVRFELKNGSTLLGNLYLTSNSPPSGWPKEAQYWHWNGGSWPTTGFTAHYKRHDAIPTSPTGVGYETGSLGTGTGKTIALDGSVHPTYEVRAPGSSTTLGYLVQTSGGLQVYSASIGISTLTANYCDDLEFHHQSGTVHVVNNSYANDPTL